MPRISCEVGIIGAGVSGLTATAILRRYKIDARCFEATERIGGRILTVHDPLSAAPVELGAEFVHGHPREIFDIVESARLKIYEHSNAAVHIAAGRSGSSSAQGSLSGVVFEQMEQASRKKDLSFDQFLGGLQMSDEIKRWARQQVEGFNAAHSSDISVGSLVRESKAADEIGGESAFRIIDGYHSIPQAIAAAIPGFRSALHLNLIAKLIRWKAGSVEVIFKPALGGDEVKLSCRQLIITVPLGVLQAAPVDIGAIHFDPEPTTVMRAVRRLRFGQVYRVTLRFRDRFWEDSEMFKRAGYVLALGQQFFAWWPMYPLLSPLLTGWTAGSAADRFSPAQPVDAATAALDSLGRIMKRKIPRPEAFYFHDWQSDPFFRGAYSYVPVDGHKARESLARPVENTLFFAGEASDTGGHASTVHGAIASGQRAARRLLKLIHEPCP